MSTGDIVTLKDGTVVAEITAQVVYMHLRELHDNEPLAFYDLVMLARTGEKIESLRNQNVLQTAALLATNGELHTDVAAIVRNAVAGDGWKMYLVSPLK